MAQGEVVIYSRVTQIIISSGVGIQVHVCLIPKPVLSLLQLWLPSVMPELGSTSFPQLSLSLPPLALILPPYHKHSGGASGKRQYFKDGRGHPKGKMGLGTGTTAQSSLAL